MGSGLYNTRQYGRFFYHDRIVRLALPFPRHPAGAHKYSQTSWRRYDKVSPVLIAGVDEVGRGPLAGPVVSAAVILDPDHTISGLADSKKLSAKKREYLAAEIKASAVCWALGRAEVGEIDQLNIFHAALLSMQRAVLALSVPPDKALVDGKFCPELPCVAQAIIKGDSKVPAISAASILAKVARDQEMLEMHLEFPEYGFDRHKGYPTRLHQQMIKDHGVTNHHRRSFRPVAEALRIRVEK